MVYLCPTVQLARQTAAKASGYGIPAVTLVRRQAEWDPAEITSYQRGKAIAVTTYSSVFNTNPILNDGQTLVLDDAHAGEEPVASLWTVRAHQGEDLFDALVGTVRDALPRELVRLLEEGDTNRLRDIRRSSPARSRRGACR